MLGSKSVKRIIAVLILVMMFFIVESVLRYALEPVSYADYFNHDVEVLAEDPKGVDLIFIGASRVYRSYVPHIFEEELGINNVLNAGSSSQPLSGTYYQLKDLIKIFSPEKVVLGVTVDQLVGDEITQGKNIVYDRINNLIIKAEYLLNGFDGTEKLYGLKSYRFRTNMSKTIIANNLRQKELIESNDYQDNTDQSEYYDDNGFVFSKSTYKTGNIPIEGYVKFDESAILPEAVEWMDKIVNICKENNIELYMVMSPTTLMRVYNTENYQSAHEWYCNYAKENGIIYHDLNLLKTYTELFTDENMHDYNHLNGNGAYEFSNVYADILGKDFRGVDTSEYFFNSVEELKQTVKRVAAVSADIQLEDDIINIDVQSLQNDNMNVEYELKLSVDGGEFKVVSAYSNAINYNIIKPDGVTNISIMVEARNADDIDEPVAFQIYDIDLSTGTVNNRKV